LGLRGFNLKILETPTTFEIWEYGSTPVLHNVDESERASDDDCEEDAAVKNVEIPAKNFYDALKRREHHYKELRWHIARIIDCNFDGRTKFMTLTFRENKQDVSEANTDFKKFIKRLNYRLYKSKIQKLKYLAVWERQKRGAVHYHIVFFDLPFIKVNDLEKIWGHGFVKLNKVDVDSRDNIGRYISKYFCKSAEEKDYKQKAFFKSRNLLLPEVRFLTVSEELNFSGHDVVFSKIYARLAPDFFSRQEGGIAFKEATVRYTRIRKDIDDGNRNENGFTGAWLWCEPVSRHNPQGEVFDGE
jgi:hypothetical protein